ncbi:MAG: hypothetical protein ACOX9C_05755 [Kiritimatiellia bacterium]|jgi:hypothetical protein
MKPSLRNIVQSVAVMLPFPALFAWLLAHPLAASFRTASGVTLHAWASKPVMDAAPFLAIVLLAAIMVAWQWIGRRLANDKGRPARIVRALRPLLFLPLAAFGGYLAPWIGFTAAGLFLPYGCAAIAAWTLENLLGDSVAADHSGQQTRVFSWSILAYGIFIFAAGLHFSEKIERKSGDEAHYLIQLESLVADGDLELSNEMEETIQKHGRDSLGHSHIIENKEGRLYSYHSFGLPLLTWPFGYFGSTGRLLALAIISTLGVAGCRAACLAAKAPPRAAAVVTWSLAFSYTWVLYSTRFLPEILGCGLLAWGCWALAAQRERRWPATLVAAVCCGFLPCAHVRWAPPSLVVAAFFGFEGLFMKDEKLGPKFRRLLAFAAIYAAFGFALLHFHATFYSGSQAYDYRKVLFSYPVAMWGMFTDRRGLLGLLPALLWFVVALPFCAALGKRAALRATESAAIFASVLLTSCTTSAALAGACIPGRYLLTAVPALLPPAALALSRCGRPARVWLYFLASMPVLFFAYVGGWIEGSPAPFFRVPEKLRDYIGFHAYWEPLTSYLDNVNPGSIACASAFIALLMVFTALLFIWKRNPKLVGSLATATFATAFAFGFQSDRLENSKTDTHIFLISLKNGWRHFVAKDQDPNPEVFQTLIGDPPALPHPAIILGDRDKTAEDPSSFISHKQVPRNDWDGRDIHWHVIRPTQIRHNFDGYFAFRVVGRVNRGRARFAVRQGAVSLEEDLVLGEGPFDFTWLVRTVKNRGFTNTIVSLEDGVGEVVVDFHQFAPCSPHLRDSGFAFPPTTQIRDLTDR